MELPHPTLRACLLGSFLVHITFLMCMINMSCFASFVAPLTNETDQIALLAFKDQISQGPNRVLSSWNYSLHFCNWGGVACSRRHPQRVTAINLTGQSLVGHLSPHLANLSFLTTIDLSRNSFRGQIPYELARLPRLRFLNLSSNSFDGEIPKNLTPFTELRVLDLNTNKLDGEIPFELGYLAKLKSLMLNTNNFIGRIPPSFANLSSLARLDLSNNSLEGGIPDNLGQMVQLEFIAIYRNNLSGMVPSSLYNHSAIVSLDVGYNRLHGSLPTELGLTLPKLQRLIVRRNKFTGPIPVSLGNNSRIQRLDFSLNKFNGTVPMNLGRLHGLKWLNFGVNNLTGDDLGFITSLTNCTGLELFSIADNDFNGVLPSSIANLSTHLRLLSLGQNRVSGSIPPGIGNLVGLTNFQVQLSLLLGPIPDDFGKLQNLQMFSFHDNNLSGSIPSSIGNITRLFGVYLYNNDLEGSIPLSLGNCQHLQLLLLSNNKLNGTIPEQVLNIASLIRVRLDENSFTGPLPLNANELRSLTVLNITNNRFSGEIPSALGNCISLEIVRMKGNFFQGSIPPSLSRLRVLHELDLSYNNISGQIPKYLEQLPFLRILNLSFNNLEGEVPKYGIFQNESAFSVLGNSKLCGGVPKLKLPTCPKQPTKNRDRIIVILVGVVAAVLGLPLSCFLVNRIWFKKSREQITSTSVTSFTGNHVLEVTYAMLFKATDGFSLANLIGVGSFGSVYKGLLDCVGTTVAIKVLKLYQRRASKSFISECKALSSIKHRNVVKILTVCTSLDFRGNEFRALVFEYMPNGSLDMWLHPDEDEGFRKLNLLQRLNIAIDVACALDYLHNHCQVPIVHCDLKPSNVLLDDDMVAHVGDFGLARILSKDIADSSQIQSSTLELKGSIGYVAPEYGMGGYVSTSGDVYSYGILLLEMLIGKKPTDDMFKDNWNLHQFAETALPEQVVEIIDHRLLSEETENVDHGENDKKMQSRMHELLISLVRIGVLCSMESPKDRMDINNVVMELHGARDFILSVEK